MSSECIAGNLEVNLGAVGPMLVRLHVRLVVSNRGAVDPLQGCCRDLIILISKILLPLECFLIIYAALGVTLISQLWYIEIT